MYILLAVLIGMALGFIRRGSIRAILEHPYKNWVFGAAGIIIQVFIHLYCFLPALPNFNQYLPIANFISYLLIFITLIYNLDDIYTILIAIGVTLNFVVTFINGGLMPVSTSVVDIMPLHAALTQSIYSGTGGVYTILVPTQTLLSFLSMTIPVPFFANVTVMTGFVSGLSIGSIFTIIGLIGLTQRAMTLPYETVSETQTVIKSAEKYPVETEEEEPQFDNKTDELFYEEDKLPRNPLDKMFKEVEPEPYPTQVLKEINVSDNIDKEREPDEALQELAGLTRPISETLTIDVEEKPEPEEEAPIEGEGYFVSQFNAEKQKQAETEEDKVEPEKEKSDEVEAVDETPADVIQLGEESEEEDTEENEKNYSRDDLLDALDSSPILEETLTDELEIEEDLFEREKLEEKIVLDEKTKEPVLVEETEVEEPEVAVETNESEKVLETEPEVVETDETSETVDDVETTESTPQTDNKVIVLPGEVVESVQETPVQLEEDISEAVEEASETETVEVEPETVETESEVAELEPEVTQAESKATEVESETAKEESNTAEIEPETTEVSETEESKTLEEETLEESEEGTKADETTQEKLENAVPLADIVSEIEPENEAILLNGPVAEETTESQTTEKSKEDELIDILQSGEADRDVLETILKQSDLENLEEILGSEIDMSSIIVESPKRQTDIDLVMKELGQKRGIIQEDERTGYMVTKAYIEMSNRDKSEEQMLDIWSQVAEENRERKLGRRRRASANYQTSNPYSEERERSRQQEIDRIRAEQEEKRWKERERQAENARHQEATAKTVNAQNDVDTTLMSEEERIAAGYEKVNFEFSGKTISFWRKKNE